MRLRAFTSVAWVQSLVWELKSHIKKKKKKKKKRETILGRGDRKFKGFKVGLGWPCSRDPD